MTNTIFNLTNFHTKHDEFQNKSDESTPYFFRCSPDQHTYQHSDEYSGVSSSVSDTPSTSPSSVSPVSSDNVVKMPSFPTQRLVFDTRAQLVDESSAVGDLRRT